MILDTRYVVNFYFKSRRYFCDFKLFIYSYLSNLFAIFKGH